MMFGSYLEWEKGVPDTIKGDVLWRMEVYRLALFLSALAWNDVTKLVKDRRTLGLSSQLYKAVGSIHANISEGFSRGSTKDQVRSYEYALGSGREARGWYYDAQHMLGEAVFNHRADLITRIIRLLLTIIPSERGATIKESSPEYVVTPTYAEEKVPFSA